MAFDALDKNIEIVKNGLGRKSPVIIKKFRIGEKNSIYNAVVLIIRDFLPKIEEKVLCIVITPAIYYISIKYGDVTNVRSIITNITPIFTIFNTVFASVIAMIILLKKDKANERK